MIVQRYLDGPVASPSHLLACLLSEDDPLTESPRITAVTQLWQELLGGEVPWLDTSVCVLAFAILWIACIGEGITEPVATTFQECCWRC